MINDYRHTWEQRENSTDPVGKFPAVAVGPVIKRNKLYKLALTSALLEMQLAAHAILLITISREFQLVSFSAPLSIPLRLQISFNENDSNKTLISMLFY